MALTVTGAVLDGETVGVRCDETGRIAAIGPEVAAGAGRRDDRRPTARPSSRRWSTATPTRR